MMRSRVESASARKNSSRSKGFSFLAIARNHSTTHIRLDICLDLADTAGVTYLPVRICRLPKRSVEMDEQKPVQALKAHVALNVKDVEASLAFYRKLLGIEPSKVRTGYAKFDVRSEERRVGKE